LFTKVNGQVAKAALALTSEASPDILYSKTIASPVIESLIPMFTGDMTKPFRHMHVRMHNGGKKRLAKRFLQADLAKI